MARARRNKIAKDKLSVERKNRNVPDWRKSEEYSYIKSLKGDALRWEFLRRDNEYHNDWHKKKTYGYIKYGLDAWHDPSRKIVPKFDKPCHLVEFSQRKPIEQVLHYEALATSGNLSDLIFSVSVYHPLKPQIKIIKELHDEFYKHRVPPDIRRKRASRKNNKEGRSPILLLRVLDADNEGADIGEMADVFGGEMGISESAMRRTIDFAKGFWQRMS